MHANAPDLAAAIRDNLSPEALVAIIGLLQPAGQYLGKNPELLKELQWFSEELSHTVGGTNEVNRIADEIGL